MSTMKKILFTIVTLLTFVACVQEDIPSVYPSTGDGMVLVEASFTVPHMHETRSFESPAISSLHLLVFDENGFLIQVCNAEPVNSFGTETGVEYKYRVELGQSNYQRTIHLIANSPITINADGTGGYRLGEHERRIIDNLYTEGGKEAYWATVDLENGITGVQKIVDGKQVFEPSEELIEALTNVPMVRNYTRVKLTNSASAYLADAELMMMNIPDMGSVAAHISDGNYAKFATHARAANTSLNYDDISAQGYDGYEPNGISLTNTTWGTMHEFYERHQQTDGKAVATPAFAIVRGYYIGTNGQDEDYSYYKVDICYTNETTGAVELYNLLRNIEYNITIVDVLGRGYGTLDEAAANAASNNLNFAIETKSLNSISDGERRLSVEYTQRVLTEGNTEFTLKYKYEPDITKTTTNNSAVVFSNLAGNVLAVNNPDGANDAAKYIVSNVAGSDGWNIVTFKSQAISGTKLQTIILTAGNLQRSIELILGEPYTMTLDMVPGSSTNIVDREIGAAVEAKISLPLGLPEALFPLEIYLVAEKMTLSPDATKNVLPVITGLSSTGVPSSSGIHFGYVVTIEASHYYVEDANGNRTGEYRNEKMLYFKTSTADSASRVNIYNPYFNNASDYFTNGN